MTFRLPKSFIFPSSAVVGSLLLTALLGVSGRAWGDDWPMFRHDATHTGATSQTLKLPLKRAWTFPTGAQWIFSSAAVVDGSVYFGTRNDPEESGAPPVPKESGGGRGSLYSLDAKTGKKKWRFNAYQGTGIGGVVSSPAVAGNRVFFSSRDGYFYCIGTDGKPVWRAHTGGTYDSSSPTVVDGKVFFSSGYPNKDFFCLSAADGKILWRIPSGTGSKTRPGQYAYVSPAVLGGVVYSGSNDAVFYALNVANGDLKWRFETPGGNPYVFAPTIVGSKLLCVLGEYNPHLYAVNLQTGTEAWNFTAPGQYFYISSPAVAKDVIYVGMGSPDQILYAINANTGKENWHVSTGFSWVQQFTSSPAVAGDLIVVGAGPESATSELKGRLFAIDATTGAVKWKVDLPKPVVASPAIANGMVFVGATDGTMYAYRDSSAGEASTQSTVKKTSAKPKTTKKPTKKKSPR